jgi:hypothetical protein
MTARDHSPVSPKQRRANSSKGGKLAQSPEGLANRLARNWPTLTAQQQAEIRRTLKPLIAKRTTPAS